jgi:hypothetical protein
MIAIAKPQRPKPAPATPLERSDYSGVWSSLTPMFDPATLDHMPLDDHTALVIRCHDQVIVALGTWIYRARETGEALLAAKRKVPHGSWTQWLEDTFSNLFSVETARFYMRIAARWDEILEAGGPYTHDHVRQLLAKPRRLKNDNDGYDHAAVHCAPPSVRVDLQNKLDGLVNGDPAITYCLHDNWDEVREAINYMLGLLIPETMAKHHRKCEEQLEFDPIRIKAVLGDPVDGPCWHLTREIHKQLKGLDRDQIKIYLGLYEQLWETFCAQIGCEPVALTPADDEDTDDDEDGKKNWDDAPDDEAD